MLFYKVGKTVAINRLDKIIRGPQIKAHRFIVDNRDHDDRNFRQCGIALQFLEHCPAIAVRHNHIKCDNQWTNLPRKPQTFFAIRRGNNVKSRLGKKTRHKVPNRSVIIYN